MNSNKNSIASIQWIYYVPQSQSDPCESTSLVLAVPNDMDAGTAGSGVVV